jgi:hypothetical protein
MLTKVFFIYSRRRLVMSERSESVSIAEAQLTAKAWKDPAFKRALLSDPKGVLQQEFGVQIPDDVTVKVVEETQQTVYFVLPAVPDDTSVDQLSDFELEAVAGRAASNTDVRSGCKCCSSPCSQLPR